MAFCFWLELHSSPLHSSSADRRSCAACTLQSHHPFQALISGRVTAGRSIPSERREAALLLAARSTDSAERSQRLLANQGWGNDPLAAVTLKQQALNAAKLGRPSEEKKRWQDLLQRFPDSAASADARYQLGQTNPTLHTDLFRQQPGHPAALAAAAETKTDSPKQAIAALHLARWGARWPGAATQLREACNRISGDGLNQDDRLTLAQALATLGDGRAAEACLQGTPTTPASGLAIGRVLLRGTAEQQERGKQHLLDLAISNPDDPAALKAAALLSEPLKPDPALLDALPQALQQRSADVAAARVRLGDWANGDCSECHGRSEALAYQPSGLATAVGLGPRSPSKRPMDNGRSTAERHSKLRSS